VDEFENVEPHDQHHAHNTEKAHTNNKQQVNTDEKQHPETSDNNNTKPQEKHINSADLMPQKVHIADDYTHKIAMMDHLMDEFAEETTIIYTATNKAAQTLQDKNIINFDLPHNIDHYLARLNRHEKDREKPTLLILDGNTGAGKKKGPNNQNAQANKGAQKDKNKNTRRNNKAKGRSKNKTGQTQEGDSAQRRQHKGAFGRLKGGTHRKTNTRKVGVSRVGTDAPKGREGKSLAAEVKERSASSGNKVKISYNKKRTLSIKKPEEEL